METLNLNHMPGVRHGAVAWDWRTGVLAASEGAGSALRARVDVTDALRRAEGPSCYRGPKIESG